MKTMKNNNYIISLFLFNLLFIQIYSNYVILPFNTKKLNSSSFLSKTNYYTLLSIGQPQKTVEMYLLLNQYNFYLGKGLCRLNSFSDYIPYESETFKNISDYEDRIGYIKIKVNASDDYFLYTNLFSICYFFIRMIFPKNISIVTIIHKNVRYYENINNKIYLLSTLFSLIRFLSL